MRYRLKPSAVMRALTFIGGSIALFWVGRNMGVEPLPKIIFVWLLGAAMVINAVLYDNIVMWLVTAFEFFFEKVEDEK